MRAQDVMNDVVTRVVAAMEAGAATWQMPWRTVATTGWPTNAVTGNRYTGGNVVALHLASVDAGHPSARWATYKQWASVGAQVRRGEHGVGCVFWKVTDRASTDTDDTDGTAGALTPARSAWARSFTVFNAAQVDNDPHPVAAHDLDPLERDARADAFFAAIPADVRWGSGNPRYQPSSDTVIMPAFDAFTTAADAYAILAHELGHWTGHPSRLARTYGRRVGDDAYAAEELVAELSAAFTCAAGGIATAARTDHAAYLAHWIRMLRAQPAILWTVAAKAQAATDWLAAYTATPADLDAD